MKIRIAICVAAVGAGVLAGSVSPTIGTSFARPASDQGRTTAVQLDDVPGFGRSSEAMDRDDQIGTYQAYLRERYVADCMRSRGYSYRIDLRYPADALRKLKLTKVDRPTDPPTQEAGLENQTYVDALTQTERDGYYQALVGESADDIAFLERNDGTVPGDADPSSFATGGCTGEAVASVGRIWDLRDKLMPKLVEAREAARSAPDMSSASADLNSCAERLGQAGVDGPWSLDDLAAERKANVERLIEVEQQCVSSWMAADDKSRVSVEAAFANTYETDLKEQLSRYGNLFDASSTDQGFADLVAGELSLRED